MRMRRGVRVVRESIGEGGGGMLTHAFDAKPLEKAVGKIVARDFVLCSIIS